MRFRNREEAGRLLAHRLKDRVIGAGIVYALPRGGVPIAKTIAQALELPLDLVIPRKLGHPWQPEYGIGAVTEHGEPVFNELERRSLEPQWLEAKIAEERREARRRRERYCGGHPRASAKDKTAILVDDGIATGLTLQAAVAEVRADAPAHLIVAVGVAPPDTAARFRSFVDDFVAAQIPELYQGSVGAYFEDFRQLTDQDVLALLADARMAYAA